MSLALIALARLPADCGAPASCKQEQDRGPQHFFEGLSYIVLTVEVLVALAVLVIVIGMLVWARQRTRTVIAADTERIESSGR
jgi:urea transporter